ncbi:MAG: D-alanyl-D-alanine carboxypeptidase [Thermodesulfobacteriota bacterium]
MKRSTKFLTAFMLIAFISILSIGGCNNNNSEGQPIPDEIRSIFNSALYDGGFWALRVVDLESGEVIYNQRSDDNIFIGSVRKVFTIGELLEEYGQDFMFRTPLHRQGPITEEGVLQGDLIVVASGDLTMGGRRLPNNTMAVTNFDHNDANNLGNAILSTPDPLQGYKDLAKQIADSGVTKITGEIIIDDRLFQPYFFRNEFDVKPIFVNDDVVDVIVDPGTPGGPAIVEYRPKSDAFSLESTLQTLATGEVNDIDIDPFVPECFGMLDCLGLVSGEISTDLVPPLTDTFPIIQIFRIADPSSYARTVLIEALIEEGVVVDAPVVAKNPSQLLPPKNSYTPETILAEYKSLPLSEYGKLVLKVSYNIGSDTSLLLWGLRHESDNMNDTLAIERDNLINNIGIPGDEFEFFYGSGGFDTVATNKAVIQMLEYISRQSFFPDYLGLLPILAVDGSLAFVTDFESDPSLAGAKGNVYAKTGTKITGSPDGLFLDGQALGGYIDTKSGKRLMFHLAVNNIPLGFDITNVQQVFQDQGTITAIIWRDN